MPDEPDFDSLTRRLEGHLLRVGGLAKVNMVEPKSPPGKGVTAALWLQDWATYARGSGADTVSLRLAFTLRLYRPAFAESRDELDRELLRAAFKIGRALCGDLDLGGTVLDTDPHGMGGVPMRGQAGYLQMADRSFRIMDITVPVLWDDVWTLGRTA